MELPELESLVKRAFGAGSEARPFGTIEWAASAEMAAALAVFDAGGDNVEHTHPNCEEAVYVLEGAIEHTLGEQSTILAAGDFIVVPRDAPHRLINRSGKPCRMLIVFTSPDREFVPTGR